MRPEFIIGIVFKREKINWRHWEGMGKDGKGSEKPQSRIKKKKKTKKKKRKKICRLLLALFLLKITFMSKYLYFFLGP